MLGIVDSSNDNIAPRVAGRLSSVVCWTGVTTNTYPLCRVNYMVELQR